MDKLTHRRGIDYRPLCDCRIPKTGLQMTDDNNIVTCEKCLNFAIPTTHPKGRGKRHHSKSRGI